MSSLTLTNRQGLEVEPFAESALHGRVSSMYRYCDKPIRSQSRITKSSAKGPFRSFFGCLRTDLEV